MNTPPFLRVFSYIISACLRKSNFKAKVEDRRLLAFSAGSDLRLGTPEVPGRESQQIVPLAPAVPLETQQSDGRGPDELQVGRGKKGT
jgi:hypothetical protein